MCPTDNLSSLRSGRRFQSAAVFRALHLSDLLRTANSLSALAIRDGGYPIEKRTALRQPGLDLEIPIFLQLGRMVPRKGVDLAIRGFTRIVKKRGEVLRARTPQGPIARLLIVGGESETRCSTATPETGRLRKIVHEEGGSDLVTFTARRDRDQLKYFLLRSFAFVKTSLNRIGAHESILSSKNGKTYKGSTETWKT